MVVVSSLGPPEQGVRLTVENCAVFINRKQLGSKDTTLHREEFIVEVQHRPKLRGEG